MLPIKFNYLKKIKKNDFLKKEIEDFSFFKYKINSEKYNPFYKQISTIINWNEF